jgi:hypothetical protein
MTWPGQAFRLKEVFVMLSSLDPKIRLLLSAMLFFLVTIFGFVCLLLSGKVMP